MKVTGNGIQGLEAWKQWCPHLIVLDLMLPGIDGMQILKNIRLEDERLTNPDLVGQRGSLR